MGGRLPGRDMRTHGMICLPGGIRIRIDTPSKQPYEQYRHDQHGSGRSSVIHFGTALGFADVCFDSVEPRAKTFAHSPSCPIAPLNPRGRPQEWILQRQRTFMRSVSRVFE